MRGALPKRIPKVLQNMSWLTAGSLISRPLWLVFLTVICIPVLGDAGYGAFTAALALMAIALTFGDSGMTQYTVREVAREPSEASRYFTNLLATKGITCIAALVAGVGVGWLLGYDRSQLNLLILAGIYFFGLQLIQFCRGFFRAFEDMKWEAGSAIVEKVVLIALGSVFLYTWRSPHGVLGGMAVASVLLLIGHVVWISVKFAKLDLPLFGLGFVRKALFAAIPLGLAAQFSNIYFRTDSVMLETMIGEAAAGQYGAAYRLMEALALLVTIVGAAVYPRLSILHGEGRHAEFTALFRKSTEGLVVVGLVIGSLYFGAADWLMTVLKGGIGVPESAGALRLLAVAVPIASANYLFSIGLMASDDHKALAAIFGLAALFNVLLNLYLIPRIEISGAAWATVFTEAAIFLCASLRLWQTHR